MCRLPCEDARLARGSLFGRRISRVMVAMLKRWPRLAALTVIAGWLASNRVLGQKPLEVLREE